MMFLSNTGRNAAAKVSISTFAGEVAEKGYIDCNMFDSLRMQLESGGSSLRPEIQVSYEIPAPEYVIGTPAGAEGNPDDEGGCSNIEGTDTSTTGPDLSHEHSGLCYSGIQHIHDDTCSRKELPCTAGCVKHTHTGDSRYGTGCYSGGKYYPGSRYYCGTFSVTGYGGSISVECGMCGNDYSLTAVYMTCGSCGYKVSYSRGQCPCSPYDDSSAYTHEKTTQSYYGLNCNKTPGSFYSSSGTLCTVCGGDGTENALVCTKQEGGYYEEDGSLCVPLCDKVVIRIIAVWKEQTVVSGEVPDCRVKAVFADGHSEIAEADMSGFDPTMCNTVQNVTLLYGMYAENAKNPGKSKTVVKIMVVCPTEDTENVLWFTETVSHDEIMEELYSGDGVYDCIYGARVELKLWENNGIVDICSVKVRKKV